MTLQTAPSDQLAQADGRAADLPFRIADVQTLIREYEDRDAEAVARMWAESESAWPGGGPGGGPPYTGARVRQQMRDESALATFLAFAPGERDGEQRVVGFCSLYDYPALPSTAYIALLSAHPGYHGRGVGRDLLKVALERTVALGYNRLDLNTWAGNTKAVPLYKKSGYFWAPETSVRMENYLPLIFRLEPAREFFRHADWYRDYKRELGLEEDDQKIGKLQVYTYLWERDGRHLKVVIDRVSNGIAALETDEYSISTSIDEPRIPIGGTRTVTWSLENYRAGPLGVTLLAEGEDSVRCAFQTSGTVRQTQQWTTTISAEQSNVSAPPNRPSNRVRSTVVIDGQAVPLALSTKITQPVMLRVSDDQLTPDVARKAWITVENPLDDPVSGTVQLVGTAGLRIDRQHATFDLAPRRSVSFPITCTATESGTHTLRAQAMVYFSSQSARLNGHAAGHPTEVLEQRLFCGAPGDLFVDQTEDAVRIVSDQIVLRVPLKPVYWGAGFTLSDRITGQRILRHDCSLGPPFSPSVLATCTWKARTERTNGGVLLTTTAQPPTLPGITFERILRFSPSGLVQVSYRVTNAGTTERRFRVNADTRNDLEMTLSSRAAIPLRAGLVVDDTSRFPDWRDPDAITPQRYAETWMAEFGDGWVSATLWRDAIEIAASWSAPDLVFDLGAVRPGAAVATPPLFVYGGQGDWHAARALWRTYISPGAAKRDPLPRPAHQARLERFTFDATPASTRLVISSERGRPIGGRVVLEASDGAKLAQAAFEDVRLGASFATKVRLKLPNGAAATDATLIVDHARSTERSHAPLFLLGNRKRPVAITTSGEAGREIVSIENGKLRLAVVPAQLARITELSIADRGGNWVNQLHTSTPGPGHFVWFNPWYGGIHPVLGINGSESYPSKLAQERFTWRETERRGAQGSLWRGVTLATETSQTGQAGLDFEVSYLTLGESNVLAVVERLENRSDARILAAVRAFAFLQPGGQRQGSTLYFERNGIRSQKRVHGGMWTSSEQWCAVAASAGEPVLALVAATNGAHVWPHDMGLEGAHASVDVHETLDPGSAIELVSYLVVADSVDQAKLYRALANTGALV